MGFRVCGLVWFNVVVRFREWREWRRLRAEVLWVQPEPWHRDDSDRG